MTLVASVHGIALIALCLAALLTFALACAGIHSLISDPVDRLLDGGDDDDTLVEFEFEPDWNWPS